MSLSRDRAGGQGNPDRTSEKLDRTRPWDPSTEDYDHGKNVFHLPPFGRTPHYRTLPSLACYLMFAQGEVHVELFERQGASRWTFSELRSLDDVVELPIIGSRLALADAYAGVPGVD